MSTSKWYVEQGQSEVRLIHEQTLVASIPTKGHRSYNWYWGNRAKHGTYPLITTVMELVPEVHPDEFEERMDHGPKDAALMTMHAIAAKLQAKEEVSYAE